MPPSERKGFLRQRRNATGMTRSTAGCQLGTSTKFSSTTQSKTISGRARRASVMAGSVWIMSPSDETLTIKTRTAILFVLVAFRLSNRVKQLGKALGLKKAQALDSPLYFAFSSSTAVTARCGSISVMQRLWPNRHSRSKHGRQSIGVVNTLEIEASGGVKSGEVEP